MTPLVLRLKLDLLLFLVSLRAPIISGRGNLIQYPVFTCNLFLFEIATSACGHLTMTFLPDRQQLYLLFQGDVIRDGSTRFF